MRQILVEIDKWHSHSQRFGSRRGRLGLAKICTPPCAEGGNLVPESTWKVKYTH